MGITGLLPFVKKATRQSHIKHFSGGTAAVDAYGWLYKGAFGCAAQLGKGEPTTVYVTFCMKYVNVLISHGVKPVLVFDGRNLPAKAVTDEKRRQNREENLAKAKDALRQGKSAWEYFTRCLSVTPQMARDLIKVLREQKIDYIIAPYEADAQLAYLARNGIVDVVITEDSDLILFGCPKILFKMSLNGDGVLFDQSRIHLTMGQTATQFQFDRFRQMCILSGCDYLPSLPGIGLGRAKKLFQMSINPDIKHTLKQLPIALKLEITVPLEYIEQFVRADNTFKYQLVFDPMTRSVVPVTPYPSGINPEELEYAGKYEKKSLALDYALGNVDINTKERVDNFDPHDSKSGYTKKSMWAKGFEIVKLSNPTTDLKTQTKHTPTNGVKLTVNSSVILKRNRRRVSSEDRQQNVTDESVGDQDLFSIYSFSGETKSNKSGSQEEEDFEVVSQSIHRSKRVCLGMGNSSLYKSLEMSGGSDGENEETTDSHEDDTQIFSSDAETLNETQTELTCEDSSQKTVSKTKNPFLKSPQIQAQVTRRSPRIQVQPTACKTPTSAFAPRLRLTQTKLDIVVKSKYFRESPKLQAM